MNHAEMEAGPGAQGGSPYLPLCAEPGVQSPTALKKQNGADTAFSIFSKFWSTKHEDSLCKKTLRWAESSQGGKCNSLRSLSWNFLTGGRPSPPSAIGDFVPSMMDALKKFF